MSNAAPAWNNFLYNAEWQHADVWIKLLQTIVMAFVDSCSPPSLRFRCPFFRLETLRLIGCLTKF